MDASVQQEADLTGSPAGNLAMVGTMDVERFVDHGVYTDVDSFDQNPSNPNCGESHTRAMTRHSIAGVQP
jgi:hypothetical protein